MVPIKPLLKRSHHVLVSEQGDVCIGEIPGTAKILNAPPEWGTVVLSLLDGQHTVPRIQKELAARQITFVPHDVQALIEQLGSHRLLEEGAYASAVLSAAEMERYDRQILQFALLDQARQPHGTCYQERLKQKRVLVLGLGGWGTWCCLNLARLGIGTLRIVDGDCVELSNLNRQVLYDADDVGASKAVAAAASLRRHNPHLNVEAVAEFASTGEEHLRALLEGVDLVVLAWASLGYYRIRSVERRLHRLAGTLAIPVIELGGDPLQISVGPVYLNDGSHPGFDQLREAAQRSFYSSSPQIRAFQRARMRNAFNDGGRLVNAWQSAPSLSIMGGLVADQVTKLLNGYDACNLVGKRLHFSLQTYQSHQEVVFEHA
ncbi:MAG: ThiF family adenylyltransferase [Stenotrophomonas sp.]|nr:ThiF family adenylyltransferase [Stenotrophomonas sp.]